MVTLHHEDKYFLRFPFSLKIRIISKCHCRPPPPFFLPCTNIYPDVVSLSIPFFVVLIFAVFVIIASWSTLTLRLFPKIFRKTGLSLSKFLCFLPSGKWPHLCVCVHPSVFVHSCVSFHTQSYLCICMYAYLRSCLRLRFCTIHKNGYRCTVVTIQVFRQVVERVRSQCTVQKFKQYPEAAQGIPQETPETETR